MLIVPVPSSWSTKKREHFVGINFLYLYLTANNAIERQKRVPAREFVAYRLLKGHVVRDHIT
jgi:hypothetical protein